MASQAALRSSLTPRVQYALDGLLRHHPDVRITSARRTRLRNRQVGGARNSRHLIGVAVDLVGPGDTLRHLKAVAPRYGATEVILESDHLHIGWPRSWAC